MAQASGSEVSEEKISISKYNPEHTDLLLYLSSAYEVLRKVFSYLCLEDIINAANAFESWGHVAKVTKKERSVIETFVVSDQRYKMAKIWSEAVFCICFCTAPNKDVEEKVAKFITQFGEVHYCLSAAGVIGTLSDFSQIIQQKVRIGLALQPKKYYVTTLRIPNVPKVGIKTFVWEENMDFVQFHNMFSIPENEIVKCLLILTINEGSGRRASMQKDDFINFLQRRQKESFAIGGCVLDNFLNYYKTSNSSNSVTKYIVFYGDNVEAASTVLTADIKTLGGINSKVKKLKEMCPSTSKGALFVFRCTGRQVVLKRSNLKSDISKWEGEAIQKYFPNTPVIGCFGYGEFGKEHPINHCNISHTKRARTSESWEFSFSTSIVYIGFMK